jgi:hypothetical protein
MWRGCNRDGDVGDEDGRALIEIDIEELWER